MARMTKKQMAEEILQASSKTGLSETRFYRGVALLSREWIERAWHDCMKTGTKRAADFYVTLIYR